MQSSNQLWYLMSRSLSGEASAEEEALLGDMLQKNTHLQQQYTILKSLWGNSHKDEAHGTAAENKRISRILQLAKVQELLHTGEDIPRKRRRLRRRIVIKVIMYAGAASAIIVATWLWAGKSKQAETKAIAQTTPSQVIATQNGSRTRTMLPDGTTVWLNAGSKISYENDFAGATRDVKLEGEAYFDVTKNAYRPFIVHTGGINIKVLGTVFNVRAYPKDKTVETTLIRGLVQITRNGKAHEKPVYLHPNEKLAVQRVTEEIINNNKQPVEELPNLKIEHLITPASETERLETAWVYNRLEFRGDDFETLAGKLERWYNISIVFDDDKVKQQTFNGSFETETVEQAFTALKTAVPFNFSINGHQVRIKSITKKQ